VVAVGYTSDTIRNLSAMVRDGSKSSARLGSDCPGLVTCTQMVSMSPPCAVAVLNFFPHLTVW
jgi:hypothetical protein